MADKENRDEHLTDIQITERAARYIEHVKVDAIKCRICGQLWWPDSDIVDHLQDEHKINITLSQTRGNQND